MPKRYASIWFRHLLTDKKAIRQPALKGTPYVLVEPQRGRKVVTATSPAAEQMGVEAGMTLADAMISCPGLQAFDGKPGQNLKLLKGLAEWCLRYTPIIALDPPEGLLLDITGCAHLKGGERPYLQDLVNRLKVAGYDVRPAIADTIGSAWGVARCAKSGLIVPEGGHRNALMPLPPSALRLPIDDLLKLQSLGFYQISSFIHIPKTVLKRRFGKDLVLRLLQALGQEEEFLLPLKEPVPYSERLECLEPVKTRVAIETGLQNLLERLCKRLYSEGLGLRTAILTWYRIDGKSGSISIGTSHASHRVEHLFKLFSIDLDQVAPGMGIELFTLDAQQTEPVTNKQSDLWAAKPGADSLQVAELIDRLTGRVGNDNIHRYLPEDRFWPERNTQNSKELKQKSQGQWREKPRPFQMLSPPETIDAMALTPDYAPKWFQWKGKQHIIVNADGPERISEEWWIEAGEHRDYYIVEDEEGKRYWLYRNGPYDADNPRHWFLHGFFA